MAVPIDIRITSANDTIFQDERLLLVVQTTAKGKAIDNVQIAFSSPNGGTLTPATGLSDANGIFETVFQPPTTTNPNVYYPVTVTCSKTALQTTSATINVHVVSRPVDLSTETGSHAIMIYEVRDDILKAIQLILDKDPNFYRSTGNTDKPVYYNGWNTSSRELPQIVISGSSMSARETSVGMNAIGDMAYSPYSGVNLGYDGYGGWYDLGLNITVVAESKTTEEKLVGAAHQAVWEKQRSYLYNKNILIRSARISELEPQPYEGNQLLYSATIDIELSTEWFTIKQYNTLITDVIPGYEIYE